jgi:hypothetical protein
LPASRGWRRVEQPVSDFQGRSSGHPGEGAGRGEGAAMQAIAGEAGEKQPALQSLVAALGSADTVRRAAGESWLAVRRATGERRPEEKGQAGEKHRPGEKWRPWQRFVVGRGGGGWPGLKRRPWQAGAAVVGYGRREDRGERDLGENGSGGR